MSALLEVCNVTKRFGGVIANDRLSLHVQKGEIVGLIGPNGSGKSTLFGCIAGAFPIDDGEILFEDLPLSHLRVRPIARLGLIRTYQQTRIYGKMTCLENMRISARDAQGNVFRLLTTQAHATDARANELLEFVGLYEKRLHEAGRLSFGQQRLLEFAMALMSEPKLLLLDEPTAGINPTLINDLMERLKRANRDFGISLLIIEHNMEVIMNLAQHIICLAHGRILAAGKPEDVRNDSRVLDAYLGAQ